MPLTRSLSAALVTALVALGCASASALSRSLEPAPRPLVLLVHGRGQLGADTASLRRSWQHSLNTGALSLAGEQLLTDSDVRLVWYADVLDPRSPAQCTAKARWGNAHAASSDAAGLRVFAGIAGAFLDALSGSDSAGDARDLRGMAGELQFLADSRKQCAAEGRLADALDEAAREHRPVVLVAHSMGALLSWDYLAHRNADSVAAGPRITRLVTIGSPVGAPEVRELVLGDGASLELPKGVRSWVNVVAPDDPFAVPLHATGKGMVNVTRTRDDGPDTHRAEGYLRDPVTVKAVLGGWCAAFGRGAPRGCASLSS